MLKLDYKEVFIPYDDMSLTGKKIVDTVGITLFIVYVVGMMVTGDYWLMWRSYGYLGPAVKLYIGLGLLLIPFTLLMILFAALEGFYLPYIKFKRTIKKDK